MNPKYGLHDQLIDQARALRAQGKTVREVASQLGVGESTIYLWFQKERQQNETE